MDNLKQELANLSWNMPDSIQQEAIERLVSIDDEDMPQLLQPISKFCWENAAKVIRKIGYPRINPITSGLLEWIADMNWPGAWIIMEILEEGEPKNLVKSIEEAIIKAYGDEDDMWMTSLKNLVTRLGLVEDDFNNSKVFGYLDEIE